MISGIAANLLKGTYYTVIIKKTGTNDVELYVNGTLVQTLAHASFVAQALHRALFGAIGIPATDPHFRVRQVSLYAKTLTDYWSARGTAGQVAAANPQRSSAT